MRREPQRGDTPRRWREWRQWRRADVDEAMQSAQGGISPGDSDAAKTAQNMGSR